MELHCLPNGLMVIWIIFQYNILLIVGEHWCRWTLSGLYTKVVCTRRGYGDGQCDSSVYWRVLAVQRNTGLESLSWNLRLSYLPCYVLSVALMICWSCFLTAWRALQCCCKCRWHVSQFNAVHPLLFSICLQSFCLCSVVFICVHSVLQISHIWCKAVGLYACYI